MRNVWSPSTMASLLASAVLVVGIAPVSAEDASGDLSAVQRGRPAINTAKHWDGVRGFGTLGAECTAVGEMFVPPYISRLKHVTFWYSGSAVVVRAGVMHWGDGAPTGAAIWESKPRVVESPAREYVPVRFSPRVRLVRSGFAIYLRIVDDAPGTLDIAGRQRSGGAGVLGELDDHLELSKTVYACYGAEWHSRPDQDLAMKLWLKRLRAS